MAQLALDQAFDRESLPQMRTMVARCASEMGATPVQADHLVLVASELITNAITYAGGSGRIKLWLNGTALYCQVSDEGPGISTPADLGIRRPPPEALGGRGLWVARSLAESIDIETGPSGTSVTVMVRLSSP